MSSKDNYTKYLNTYGGKRLLETYSLSTVGLWHVEGEDPNCDLGGSHHNPHLCYLEGKLEDVIREAVDLPRFWQWGGGGQITKVETRKANPESAKRRRELKARLAQLDEERKRLAEELGDE